MPSPAKLRTLSSVESDACTCAHRRRRHPVGGAAGRCRLTQRPNLRRATDLVHDVEPARAQLLELDRTKQRGPPLRGVEAVTEPRLPGLALGRAHAALRIDQRQQAAGEQPEVVTGLDRRHVGELRIAQIGRWPAPRERQRRETIVGHAVVDQLALHRLRKAGQLRPDHRVSPVTGGHEGDHGRRDRGARARPTVRGAVPGTASRQHDGGHQRHGKPLVVQRDHPPAKQPKSSPT